MSISLAKTNKTNSSCYVTLRVEVFPNPEITTTSQYSWMQDHAYELRDAIQKYIANIQKLFAQHYTDGIISISGSDETANIVFTDGLDAYIYDAHQLKVLQEVSKLLDAYDLEGLTKEQVDILIPVLGGLEISNSLKLLWADSLPRLFKD